ncbi:solute carrier family 23 member 3 [Eublepharis macularius]|uniref:Solute carrier family 23 member 3 n=1 Tax=Eublepharis macularius TaxID=481883 RepID=A0AA97IW02_EUBMA|nr:solute carrier family 23 member 3 [Eublepharis macularius]
MASQSILPCAHTGPRFPPWPLSCLLALQHLLVQASFLCIFHLLFLATLPPSELDGFQCWNELLARNFFACGISTALQCGLGTGLPLVQAPSFEFLIPAMVLTQHTSPIHQLKENSTEAPNEYSGPNCENTRNWDWSLREISGAVLISAAVQMVLGMSGACGWIAKRCGPMVLAPSLSVIGLSAYRPAALLCSENWGVAMLLVLLSILLSQHLASCRLPLCQWSQAGGLFIRSLHMFSVLLPVSGIWLVFGILNPIPVPWDVLHPSVHHLTLPNNTLQSPWLQVPYPGELGWPLLSTPAVGIGSAMGIAASMNSIGCYLLCSKALREPPAPQHACNRGLCAEGLGSLLSAVLGSVSGTASSMPNVCASRLTQATSFRSVWVSALACILLGLSPRLTGLLATIPLAVHGGMLCVTYSVAVGTGISYFQYTNIDSGRNIFIVGFTMFMGLLVPKWLFSSPGSLTTGCVPVDLFLLSLLMVPAFITGVLSFFLENTVSGTLQERGLLNHLVSCKPETAENSLQLHNKDSVPRLKLPLFLRMQQLPSWCKAFPFCFLCPLKEAKEEIVNSYHLEELHCSSGETADLLLKPGTVELESNIKPETLENHKCVMFLANKRTLCSDASII